MRRVKYKHTAKDKEDDVLLIKEFSNAFEEQFKSVFHLSVYNFWESEGKEDYKYCIPHEFHGAQTIYAMRYDEQEAIMIWISTDINPNGVGNNIIARDFTIQYQKNVKWKAVENFRGWSINSFDEVINKFKAFLTPEGMEILKNKVFLY